MSIVAIVLRGELCVDSMISVKRRRRKRLDLYTEKYERKL
jgi:hypothetical protein